jgi:transposase
MAPAQRGTQNQAIGRSRGGLTTKIMALVDALGNLVRFILLPGQRHDSIGVEPLITGLDFEALIGDKAFDSNWLRANLNERGAVAVIPSKANRARPIPHDVEIYKWRHLVENFFCSLKAFRRIATRYEKTDACFAGILNLVAAFLLLR